MFRCDTLLCHASDLLWNMRCWPMQETKQWINQFWCISPLFILQESIMTLFYWKQEVINLNRCCFRCGHSTVLDMDISKWYTSWCPILQLFFFFCCDMNASCSINHQRGKSKSLKYSLSFAGTEADTQKISPFWLEHEFFSLGSCPM